MFELQKVVHRWRTGLVWGALGILLLLIVGQRGLTGEGDDLLYARALEQTSWPQFLSERYRTWSGRVPIDAAVLFSVRHLWLWRLTTAGLVLLGLASALRMMGVARSARHVVFAGAAFFLIDPEVLWGSVWWVTGSHNYLWPLALGTFALTAFLLPTDRRLLALTIPAAAFASFQEQSALLLLGLQGILGWHLLRHGRLRAGHVVQCAVSLCGFALLLAAPGSRHRTLVHLAFWFPEYLNSSWFDRFFSGADLALSHMFLPGNAIVPVVVVLTLAAVWQRSTSVVDRTLAALPACCIAVPFVLTAVLGSAHPIAQAWGHMMGFAAASESVWIGDVRLSHEPVFYVHFWLFSTAAACLCASIGTALTAGGTVSSRRAIILFGAAALATTVTGFSPALYASGKRVFLFQDFVFLCLACALFARMGMTAKRRVLWCVMPLAALGVWATLARI